MAAGGTAEDAVFVLEADDVGVGEVEVIGRPEIGIELLLLDLEPDLRGIVVALGEIVDRNHEAIGAGKLGGDRGADIVREGGDAALARQIIADEGDLADVGIPRHGST